MKASAVVEAGQASLSQRLKLASKRTLNSGETREAVPLAVALLVVVIVFQLASGLFLSPRNLTNLLVQLVPLALIAIASTVMIVMGEIDLSLGSIAGFAAAVGAVLLANGGIPWYIAVGATFLIGMAVAGAQGLIVVVGRVRSFAVTLAGFLVWYGMQIAVLGKNGQQVVRRAPISELSLARVSTDVAILGIACAAALIFSAWLMGMRRARLGRGSVAKRAAAIAVVASACIGATMYVDAGKGIPVVFIAVLGVTAAMWFALTRTATGRHLYAVGGDLEAARESGVNVRRVKIIGFVCAGALAVFAGFAIMSYTGGADTSTGTGTLLLSGIGAAVVGGVSLIGGRGSIWGAFGGAILLAAVQNGLNLLNLPFYAVYIVEGLVVLAALLADAGLRRRLAT